MKLSTFAIATAAICFSGFASSCSPPASQTPPATQTTTTTATTQKLLGERDPTLDQATAAQGGAALAVSHVEKTGDMVESGAYHDIGASPLSGQTFGTFTQHGDAGTGAVSFEVQIPQGATAIGIPVLTGPAGAGTFRVSAAGSDTAVAELKNAPGLAFWRIWKVTVPANTTSLTIHAEDTGTAWGQWVGIGTPHALK